jgi:hypothetical protein
LWTRTYGGTGHENARFVQQTSDGGYIVTGQTAFGAGNIDVYLTRTNANGDTLWTKTFGGTGGDRGYSVQQASDGGYIISGSSTSFGSVAADVYLIKTDTNGIPVWEKTFGDTLGTDEGFCVQQTTDGGYIIAGRTSFGAGGGDAYLIKTDSNGDTLWTKTYGGLNTDVGNSVRQTIDEGYIIAGYTSSFGAGSSDGYLIKTDANGDTLWTKTYGGTGSDYFNSIQQTFDGGYIITGYTYYSWVNQNDVFLIKTDANGDTLWTKSFGGADNDFGNSIQQTTDGGYIIIGQTQSFGAGWNVYLIKTDSLGNSGCNEPVTVIIVTSPPSQVTSPATVVTSPVSTITAPATIVGSGSMVTTLCTTVGINEMLNQEELVLFPNPFTDKLTITTETNEPVEITLFDVTARKLLQQTFTNAVTLNTSQLAKGIYIYEVRNKDGLVKKGKVVKE